jgi:hypothetical protein
MNENSEDHSPVCPSSTLHIDGIDAQSLPAQKPESGLGNVLGAAKGRITRTLCTLLGETHAVGEDASKMETSARFHPQIGSSIESIYE